VMSVEGKVGEGSEGEYRGLPLREVASVKRKVSVQSWYKVRGRRGKGSKHHNGGELPEPRWKKIPNQKEKERGEPYDYMGKDRMLTVSGLEKKSHKQRRMGFVGKRGGRGRLQGRPGGTAIGRKKRGEGGNLGQKEKKRGFGEEGKKGEKNRKHQGWS